MTGADMVAVKAACCEGSQVSCSRTISSGSKLESGDNKFQGELQRFTRDQGEQKKSTGEKKVLILQGNQKNLGKSSSEGEKKQTAVEDNTGHLVESFPEINSQTEVLLDFKDLLADLSKEIGNDDLLLTDVQGKASEALIPTTEELMTEALIPVDSNSSMANGELQLLEEKTEAVKAVEAVKVKDLTEVQLNKQAGEFQELAANIRILEKDELEAGKQSNETGKTTVFDKSPESEKIQRLEQVPGKPETAVANKFPESEKIQQLEQIPGKPETELPGQFNDLKKMAGSKKLSEVQTTSLSGKAIDEQELDQLSQKKQPENDQLLSREGLTSETQEVHGSKETAEGKQNMVESQQFHNAQEEPDTGEVHRVKKDSSGIEQFSANTRTNSLQADTEEGSQKTSINSWLLGMSIPSKNSAGKVKAKEEQGLKQKVSETLTEQEKNQGILLHNKKESKNESGLKTLLKFEPEEELTKEKVPTDVKKLMEFENKRLSASKLEKELPKSEEIQSDKKPNDGSKISILGTKAELDSSKSPSRELNFLSANKTPLEAKEIVEQLVKKAELLVKLNSSEMKIQLKPEYLGKMTIRVSLDEGVLTARFITENHQVKQILESNLSSLRQALESQGIRVEKTEVNVQLNNGGMFDGSEGNHQEVWQGTSWFSREKENHSGEDPQFFSEIDELELEEENLYYPQDYGLNVDGSMNLLI